MASILERMKSSIAATIGDDTTRMRARREKKRQWRECETKLMAARIEQQQQRDIERRKDEAANLHQSICTPLQERRSDIESAITDCLVEGRPVPSELEAEQIEVMSGIAAATETLDREIKSLDKLHADRQKEIRRLQSEAAREQVFANELAQEPLANPQLLLRQHAAQQAVVWLGHRVRAAGEHVNKWQAHVDALKGNEGRQVLSNFGRFVPEKLSAHESQQLEIYSKRVARWRFELGEATAALATANAECDRLRLEIIDE